MKNILSKFQSMLQHVCEWVAYLLVVIFLIITYEVIARYFFGKPTSWAWVITQQLFLVVCLFGGVYAFIKHSHIRIEMLHEKFPRPLKLLSKVLTLALFLVFAGVFVWKGMFMAQSSIAGKEVARGAFQLPIYPFKALMPLVGLLFLIQGVITIFKDKK